MNDNNKRLTDARRYIATAIVALCDMTEKGEELESAEDALLEVYRVIRQEIKYYQEIKKWEA